MSLFHLTFKWLFNSKSSQKELKLSSIINCSTSFRVKFQEYWLYMSLLDKFEWNSLICCVTVWITLLFVLIHVLKRALIQNDELSFYRCFAPIKLMNWIIASHKKMCAIVSFCVEDRSVSLTLMRIQYFLIWSEKESF